MKTRRFVIKCINEEACLELLNKITEEVSALWMKTEVKKNQLLIEAIGMPYELKELRYQIEEIKKRIEMKYRPYVEIKASEFPKRAQVSVPLDALVEALKLMGYQASLDGDTLKVDADFEEVVEVAKKIKEIYDTSDVVRFRLPHSAKKAVAVISTALSLDPEEVVNALVDMGFLREGDFKYEIAKDWREMVREAVKVLRD